MASAQIRRKLRPVFAQMDLNDNGEISTAELKRAAMAVQKQADAEKSQYEAQTGEARRQLVAGQQQLQELQQRLQQAKAQRPASGRSRRGKP